MKSFICIFLLVFIACDVVEKKDEIVLKDFSSDLFEKFVNIIKNCGETNYECIGGQIKEVISEMTIEEITEYHKLIESPECKSECIDIFSGKIYDYFTEIYCTKFCPNSLFDKI